jgi:hypothetical protein
MSKNIWKTLLVRINENLSTPQIALASVGELFVNFFASVPERRRGQWMSLRDKDEVQAQETASMDEGY